ncbi:MAG: M20 family metallo-hydrolase [Saprospiraceae bacterium]|nr:M20 family metallo-hydrolase [Saprospiraceae bacterium]
MDFPSGPDLSPAALSEAAILLLQQLIATPSFSGEEAGTAQVLEAFLAQFQIPARRLLHNVWATNRHFSAAKPSLLLCSHHDTVRPNPGYTRDPFVPEIIDGKLYGLGSNDAGGCLISLAAAFVALYERSDLPFNLVFAGVAEEETSGKNGLERLLPELPPLSCGIIGEPTLLDLAVAEKGLLVLDCVAQGRAGHAAREEGENALYAALADIAWFRDFRFPRQSEWLGPVKMTVTVIETPNRAHNVVPDTCRFVVDVRLTDAYTPEEVLATIRANVGCSVTPRSTRLRASAIDREHPLVQAGLQLGKRLYGSPTTSDKALMPVSALKLGPGDSARSHTADEFIYLDEVRAGVAFYLDLLSRLPGL